ncbi:sodium/glucose cotransporter 4 isoform X3 [Patella vulgata]|nr:sodium/glucose cotransporter 4 isoform X3 [Patella vulgata]
MKWFPVGASLFSSNIGSEHFVGLAGSGAASGISNIMYEWIGMPLVICLGWIFLPVYISAGVYTMPEYMEKRFGGKRIRVYLSCLSLVLYIVTKLAVSIYAGGLFIKLALAWNMYISVTGLLLITGLYTVLGLAAVMYTDTLQTIVMTVGALVLCVIGFNRVGGYEALQYKYMEAMPSVRANNTTCGEPRADAFHIFRDPINSDNPWPGLLIQTSLGCIWYWCCDQVIVQRTLAAKNLTHAKAGSILAGYLKFLPLFLMIFPGMISRVLFPDFIACVDPAECEKFCENAVGCSNIAYPKLVLELLPVGLRGLLMAVMLSAIMSSLTSIFNSASTLFTMDLWRRMRPVAQERELLIVGRFCVLVLCGVSIVWIPLVKSSQGGQLFNYINAVQGYLGTPITSLFVMAVFWKRMNENGAFWGIAVGHVCGVIRMAVDFSYPAPECGEEESRPSVLLYVHYTYYCAMSLIITCMSIVIFSLISKAPTKDQLRGVTYWTRIDKLEDNSPNHVEENPNSPLDEDSDMKLKSSEDIIVEDDETKDCKYWVRFICGIPKKQQENVTPHISRKQIRQFLYEKPKWKTFMNINAVIGLLVMVFLTGFFA